MRMKAAVLLGLLLLSAEQQRKRGYADGDIATFAVRDRSNERTVRDKDGRLIPRKPCGSGNIVFSPIARNRGFC